MDNIEVIGTSHIAQQSIDDIRRKIYLGKPDIVAVELDALRFQDLMSKKNYKKKLRFRDIKRIGLFGWLFAVIGSFVQKRLGKKVGSTPGSDMKSAVLAGREVGSQIALIDRDIRETVYRLSKKVPLREKLYLLWFIFFGWIFERKEIKKMKNLDLRKVPSSTAINFMIYEFRHKFPKMYKVLVSERDEYMSRKINLIRRKFPEAKMIVVVGAGHAESLKKILDRNKAN